jgi:hypothetical protein
MTEARACLHAEAFTASAIMCRRGIESIAHDHDIKERNLAGAIERLRDDKVISEQLFDWCTELRLAGNDAAHSIGSSISAIDALDMNDLTEALIDYIYVFQARYESFKARRRSIGTGIQ